MNHSCQPNCAGTELGLEIALVDIEIGDELTNDYATLGISTTEGFPAVARAQAAAAWSSPKRGPSSASPRCCERRSSELPSSSKP